MIQPGYYVFVLDLSDCKISIRPRCAKALFNIELRLTMTIVHRLFRLLLYELRPILEFGRNRDLTCIVA